MNDTDSSVVVVDLGTNRVNHDTERMRSLQPGEKHIYSHFADNPETGKMELKKTRFSVWIATRRRRLGRNFKWKAVEDRIGIYEIWVDE